MKARKAWLWALGALAVMAGIGAYVWVDAQSRATEVFKRHEAEVAAKIAALRGRKGAHPPIVGEVIPGNGWPLLLRALQGFRAIPEADADQVPELNGAMDEKDYPPPTTLDPIFARHAAPFDELRLALRHTEVDPAYDYEQGLSLSLEHLAHAIRAARFLAGAASNHHRAVRDPEAVDPLLMGLGMAQDVGRDGPLIAALVQIVCEAIAIETWREILGSHGLSTRDLARAAEGMEALRVTRPEFGDSCRIEDVMGRRTLVLMGLSGADPAQFEVSGFWSGRSWRHLYSRRLACAGALPVFERFYRDLEGIQKLPLHEREAASEKAQGTAFSDPNPYVRMALPAVTKVYGRDAIAQMNWTLMRVATAVAGFESEKGAAPASLGELVPRYLPRVPDCPLTGKPLGYAPGKVWSYGVDGVDQGGVPSPTGDEAPGGDVVWTVKRK